MIMDKQIQMMILLMRMLWALQRH